jgi:hypothetical protein
LDAAWRCRCGDASGVCGDADARRWRKESDGMETGEA